MCSKPKRNSNGFGTMWGWLFKKKKGNGGIFIFGWTIYLNSERAIVIIIVMTDIPKTV